MKRQCSCRESIHCPVCGEPILKVSETCCVLKGRYTLFRASMTTTICKRCKREVKVPIKLAS